MRIVVKAKTGARKTEVKKISDKYYVVSVPEIPEDGKANAAIIKALAKRLKVPPSSVSIRIGKTSKEKLIDIKE